MYVWGLQILCSNSEYLDLGNWFDYTGNWQKSNLAAQPYPYGVSSASPSDGCVGGGGRGVGVSFGSVVGGSGVGCSGLDVAVGRGRDDPGFGVFVGIGARVEVGDGIKICVGVGEGLAARAVAVAW